MEKATLEQASLTIKWKRETIIVTGSKYRIFRLTKWIEDYEYGQLRSAQKIICNSIFDFKICRLKAKRLNLKLN